METKATLGKWQIVYDREEDYYYIVSDLKRAYICGVDVEADANLIVALQNAAIEINPSNPLAAAKGYKEVVEALRGLMIAYNIDAESIIVNQDPYYWEQAVKALANIESKE